MSEKDKDKEETPFAIDGELRPKPKAVTMLSSRLFWGFIIGVACVFLVGMISFQAASEKQSAPPPERITKTHADAAEFAAPPASSPASAASMPASASSTPASGVPGLSALSNIPSGSVGQTPTGAGLPAAGAGFVPNPMLVQQQQGGNGMPSSVIVPQITEQQIDEEKTKAERKKRMEDARKGGLEAKAYSAGGSGGGDAGSLLGGKKGGDGGMGDILALAEKQMGLQKTAYGASSASSPPKVDTEQQAKQAFLKEEGSKASEHGYHPFQPQAALSKNEIKVGSFLPMTLEQGINSDLPGLVTARVAENVYDTMSGCRLLVPAMSKVIGKYDSQIAVGQERNLVVWNAMVFPDGSELNLAAMQGYDSAGYAGLNSEVNNHYMRLFGLTFGMSMITAGVQLSVPQQSTTTTTTGQSQQQTPAQTVQTALVQQYGQLGAQIIGKYLAVQPTLTNKPGERFIVMIPRTIVLPKVWRSRC